MTTMSQIDLTRLTISDFFEKEDEDLNELSIFEFDGFDPVAFRKFITTKLSDKDIKSIIRIGYIRSTNISKVKATMSQEGQKRITEIMAKCEFVRGVGENKGKEVITVNRIMCAFPDYVLRTAVVYAGQIFPKCYTVAENLPMYLKTPTGASFCTANQYKLWQEWNFEFDKLVNTKFVGDDEKRKEQLRKFSDISFNNQMTGDEETRLRIQKSAEVKYAAHFKNVKGREPILWM